MKFQAHGIKTSEGLEKAFYMISCRHNGEKFIRVCADSYKSFSKEIREAFKVRNDSDSMTDYFDKDDFEVTREHPLFQDVVEGFRKKLAFRLKSKNARTREYTQATLEELNQLSA